MAWIFFFNLGSFYNLSIKVIMYIYDLAISVFKICSVIYCSNIQSNQILNKTILNKVIVGTINFLGCVIKILQ